MIRGYPRHASIWPGERLQLHVSTDRPRFRAALYRWGDGYQLLAACHLDRHWQEPPPRDRRVERITRNVLDRLLA